MRYLHIVELYRPAVVYFAVDLSSFISIQQAVLRKLYRVRYSALRSSKVIEICTTGKRMCDFLQSSTVIIFLSLPTYNDLSPFYPPQSSWKRSQGVSGLPERQNRVMLRPFVLSQYRQTDRQRDRRIHRLAVAKSRSNIVERNKNCCQICLPDTFALF